GGAAMPMLFVRRNPDDIARPDLAHRPALGLNPADARDDVQRLAQGVRMPIGPCARLEGDAGRDDPRRGCGRDDRVLPDRAGEILLRRLACLPRTGEMDIHGVPPSLRTNAGCVPTISSK